MSYRSFIPVPRDFSQGIGKYVTHKFDLFSPVARNRVSNEEIRTIDSNFNLNIGKNWKNDVDMLICV